MRILFANEKCGFFGGVEQNIAETAMGLSGRGHECILAYAERTGRGEEAFLSAFSRAFPLDSLARECAANPVDVLYVHKITAAGPVVLAAKAARNVRMVHDHDLCCPRRHKYYWWNGRVCTRAAGWFCRADLAFLHRTGKGVSLKGMSEFFRELAANHLFDHLVVGSRFMRDELAANGFDTGRIRMAPPVSKPGLCAATPCPMDPVVLYVGQVIRGKGVDLLLRALAMVPPPWKAEIVGTGNALPAMKALCVRLGIQERVEFHGWMDHGELPAVYARARAVAVPSRWPEPFGMVGLDAMRHGRAVAAFAVGGIPDWLSDAETGILAPQQDVCAFAEALGRLLHEAGLAERLGGAGVERARKHFSFEAYLDTLEQLFMEGTG